VKYKHLADNGISKNASLKTIDLANILLSAIYITPFVLMKIQGIYVPGRPGVLRPLCSVPASDYQLGSSALSVLLFQVTEIAPLSSIAV
jgi:hypothetical protein